MALAGGVVVGLAVGADVPVGLVVDVDVLVAVGIVVGLGLSVGVGDDNRASCVFVAIAVSSLATARGSNARARITASFSISSKDFSTSSLSEAETARRFSISRTRLTTARTSSSTSSPVRMTNSAQMFSVLDESSKLSIIGVHRSSGSVQQSSPPPVMIIIAFSWSAGRSINSSTALPIARLSDALPYGRRRCTLARISLRVSRPSDTTGCGSLSQIWALLKGVPPRTIRP
jgi:hypothetical protein